MVEDKEETLAQARAGIADEDRDSYYADLTEFLVALQEADTADPPDYESRYGAVLVSVAAAWLAGLEAGFGIDPAQPEWPVAYIELPTGQVSWHMLKHSREWDGHDTATKHERVMAFIREHVQEDE